MRRLILAAALLAVTACRREEKIKLEATDESPPILMSTVQAGDPRASLQLIKGFHGVEQNAWRWTMGQFAISLQPPGGATERGATLVMKFSVPEAATSRLKKTTLTASIGKTVIGTATYTAPGEQTFTAEVSAALVNNDVATVEFALDPFLAAGTLDGRELGVIFVSASLEPR